jgi:hypothetical protein
MSKLSEGSEWYKGKTPFIEDFVEQRQGLLSNAASRNFTTIPGHFLNGLTVLELKTKQALSGLNYDITARAIERELAQQGIDYDLAYKNAVTLWEVEKAILLDDLTRELSDSQAAREDKEQILAALAVEVGLRQIGLINAKTLLEIETEELRKQIVEEDGKTLPYEVQLAEEKLATATRKLAIIPYLNDVMAAEEDLIAAETVNTALSEDLIDARLLQIPIRQDTANLKEYLLTLKDTLTSVSMSVAEKKALLAAAKLTYETKAADKVTPTNELVTAMTGLNAALQLYVTKKGELVIPYLARATKLEELITPAAGETLSPVMKYSAALLETLPYITALADAKATLITPSLAKATALGLLIAPLQAKAAKTLLYSAELAAQNQLEQDVKNIALDIENLKKEGINADLSILGKRLEEGNYQKALVEANVILRTLEENNKAELMGLDATQTVSYVTEKEEGQVNIVAKEIEAATVQVDTKYDVAQTKMDTALDSTRTTIGARAGSNGSLEKIGKYRANERKKTAEIAAMAKITSTLIHQIS